MIALGCSGLAIANKIPAAAGLVSSITAAPRQFAASVGALTTQANTHVVEPIVKTVAPYVTLDNLGSVASAAYAIPKTISEWSKGNRKTAAFYALAGATATVAPHVLKDSVAGTLQATKELGSKALSTGLEWAGKIPGVSKLSNAPGYLNTSIVQPLVKTAGPYFTTANYAGGVTAAASLPVTAMAWKAGYKKTAATIAAGGLTAGIALPHLITHGLSKTLEATQALGSTSLGAISRLIGFGK